MPKLLVTGPVVEPINYFQALGQLRINPIDSAIDETVISYLNTLIKAVRKDVEKVLARKLITQTWKYYLDRWPRDDYIEIPFPPLQSVSSVNYMDTDATTIPLTVTTDYIVDSVSEPGRIVLPYSGMWPTGILYPVNPIEIEFVCGYGDNGEDVEEPIIQAMLLQVAAMYMNREEITDKPVSRLGVVDDLLFKYRIIGA